MLSINSINKGIVIDHITAGRGTEIFELLHLRDADFTVALIMNAQSQKMGRKDMIKIENTVDIDLNILKLIDDGITINIIKDGKIAAKQQLVYPEKVTSLICCSNPRCISSSERNCPQSLSLVDEEQGLYRCDYCEHEYTVKSRSARKSTKLG